MSVLIVIAGFFLAVGIYAYVRFSGAYGRPHSDEPIKDTSSAKLYHSKAHDAAFFDGESEGYAEANARLRQMGCG